MQLERDRLQRKGARPFHSDYEFLLHRGDAGTSSASNDDYQFVVVGACSYSGATLPITLP